MKPLAEGAKVGRYVVRAKLGSGGMGVVYVAHDPELDRDVALKLLRPGGSRKASSLGRARLLREAQAMAKLSHPNVVTIHDVGEHEGAVYLAMELIDGWTMQKWIERERPRWPAVLEVFLQAGRGLAAAHDKELVHRDFKPDNVMVSRDGRVLVMDFGLARTKGEVSTDEHAVVPSPHGSVDRLSNPLTQAGSLVGTPAYMAPEQHLGLDIDARSDQFSYCVALFEALFGERPFAGESVAALAFNVTQGRVRDVTPREGVPGWLKRVCLRGLRPEPDDRFGSMSELLATLERARSRARRTRGLLGAGVVAAIPELAEARFLLARALWETPPRAGGDRKRAIALATEVAEFFRASKGLEGMAEFVDAWIADHGGRSKISPAG